MGKKRKQQKKGKCEPQDRAEKGALAGGAQFMALGSEVVDLVGFTSADDLHEAGAVGEVTVVQLHVCRIETHRERKEP